MKNKFYNHLYNENSLHTHPYFWSSNLESRQSSSKKANVLLSFLIILSFFAFPLASSAQNQTVKSGAFIINMGVIPQTVNNGLKPYGMIYDLISNHKVTVLWSINPNKVKDGTDFSYAGVDYKGGTFIIPAAFRSSAVNSRISYWQSQGVVGVTTTSDIAIPIIPTFGNLSIVPRWTMDKKNGNLVVPYFVNAGIPPSAHGGSSSSGWKDPAELDCCDDLFVLPHADPIWATHNRLFSWNLECKGGIWNSCHSGSALENVVNPANRNQQLNFLTTKDPAYTGNSGNYANSNTLILWGDHSDGSPPYSYRLPTEPISQYMGTIDDAIQNGSEQIFMPRQTAGTIARWNPTSKILVYDPSQVDVPNLQGDLRNAAVAMVYGRGFEDTNRGFVMHTAAHSGAKASSFANVAAQRSFFNYSWMVAIDKAQPLSIATGTSSSGYGGQSITLTFDIPNGSPSNYSIQWNSTCGGTFSNGGTTQTVQYTPPATSGNVDCILTVTLIDACGRVTAISQNLEVLCDYNVSHTKINPTCNGNSNGSINLNVTGFSVSGANTWNWSRVSPSGTSNGTTSQISGLITGTYNITVTSTGGCSATFNTSLSEPTPLAITPTVTNYQCFGQTGAIYLNVTGGTQPYSYLWSGGTTSQNRTGLIAGIYNVTVTDANNCTAIASSTVVGQVSSVTLTSTKTDISCFGISDGTISLTASGSGHTYMWSDGNTSMNRSGLNIGNYTVTLTDSNGCTYTSNQSITQPSPLNVLITSVDPTCPSDGVAPVNSNGSISLTVTGGSPAYTYSWAGGLSTQNRANLPAGNYTVTITDSKGCTSLKSVTLTPIKSLPIPPLGIIR